MRDILKEGARGADTRRLQTLLNATGANVNVDGIFGEVTRDAVGDFQATHALERDCICGPLTWDALERAVLRRNLEAAAIASDKLPLAGQKAIERARQIWQSDVFDPSSSDMSPGAAHSKAMITDIIRDGLGSSWIDAPGYKGDGDFEWCGAFAAACWYEVKPGLRNVYFASTYRLDRFASYRAAFGEKNEGRGRLYAELDENSKSLPFEPAAGDILMIGPKGGYGQHICLVEAYDAQARLFATFEGNAGGAGPTGSHRQGVVRAVRALGKRGNSPWCARRLIRPSVDDLG